MTSSTLVPVYQHIGRLYVSVFNQLTIRICNTFVKCFYNCGVAVKNHCTLHFNSWKTVCSPSPCIMSKFYYKLKLLENIGQMHVLLSCEACFFRVLRHKADSWSCAQTLPLCKNVSAFAVTESEISNQFMCNFLQVSCSSNENVIQQEWSNCFISSVRLSVQFDSRNFALALVAPSQSFLYNFRLDHEW